MPPMPPKLKIVTTAFGLVSSLLVSAAVGCTGHMRSLRQGETTLSDMQLIKSELASTYLISLTPSPRSGQSAAVVDGHARDLLRRYVELSQRVLKLDDQKGIAVTGRAQIEAERAYAQTLLDAPAN